MISLTRIYSKISALITRCGRKCAFPLLFTLLGITGALSSCSDSGNLPDYEDEEPALMFTVHLDRNFESRADGDNVSNFDNYVDIDYMFRVMFFDNNGDFLFESRNRVVTPAVDLPGQWYVTIPFSNDIKDYKENIIPLLSIREALQENDFKIAVIANWTMGGNPYEINWGWKDSKLNTEVSKPKNINDLHHLEQDAIYSGNNNLSFLADNGTMGIRSDWATESSHEDVEKYYKGFSPTKSQPIPMYGVQNFGKITNWDPSRVLDLSQNRQYIYLVRALAKVELYLPSTDSGGRDVTSVVMRGINKSARCEPVDVETPTNLGWSKYTGNLTSHDSKNCESFDITEYGPASAATSYTYKEWLSWIYGSWQYKKGNTSYEKKGTGEWSWPMDGVTVPEKKTYPHIFNPVIDNIDFCEFLPEETDPVTKMRKYVIYVPEKNVMDPSDLNDTESDPIVPHIEFRYEQGSSGTLNDNNCFRIYFTDYSQNDVIKKIQDDGFAVYENNPENLKKHWPIMRNHIYRFYVGSNNVTQEIYVKVNAWGEYPDPKEEKW